MTQLSSDILESQFGPTSVRVLLQNSDIRVIETVTEAGQVLERSLVHFMPEGVKAFPEVHAAIRAGQSMGKAFRERDVAFVRQETFASRRNNATVVGVTILVGQQQLPYAQITETYIGDVAWPKYFGEFTKQATDDLVYLDSLKS